MYPVFYPACLFSRDVDVQLSYQRFGDRPSGLEGVYFFSFGDFCKSVIVHSVYMVSPYSSSDSVSSYHNLDLADAFVANPLSQSLAT